MDKTPIGVAKNERLLWLCLFGYHFRIVEISTFCYPTVIASEALDAQKLPNGFIVAPLLQNITFEMYASKSKSWQTVGTKCLLLQIVERWIFVNEGNAP